MPGFSDRVPAVMAACDVVCMPSHTEGLPITLLEAMAVGRPLAVTRVGEMPNVLGDGRGGLVLEPDDEASMGTAIGGFLDDPDDRTARVRWATARLEADFSARRMVESYWQVYAQTLGVLGEEVRHR
jgi:glycosyltransferase involved in cell wall biosynthesis